MGLHQLFIILVAVAALHIHNREVGYSVVYIFGGLKTKIYNLLVRTFLHGALSSCVLVEVGVISVFIFKDRVTLVQKLLCGLFGSYAHSDFDLADISVFFVVLR